MGKIPHRAEKSSIEGKKILQRAVNFSDNADFYHSTFAEFYTVMLLRFLSVLVFFLSLGISFISRNPLLRALINISRLSFYSVNVLPFYKSALVNRLYPGAKKSSIEGKKILHMLLTFLTMLIFFILLLQSFTL